MNAWLLTWEGTSNAVNAKNKLLAVISSRRSSRFVHDVVALLYGRSVDSASEAVFVVNRNRDDELLATYSQSERFFYGRNPLIFARRVSNLHVARNEKAGVETVTWIDPPYLRIESAGGMPVVAEPERRCRLVRPIHRPLSADLYDRDNLSNSLPSDAEWYTTEPVR